MNDTLRTIVREQTERLRTAGIPSAGLEAQLLAAFALGVSREELLRCYDDAVSYEAGMRIGALVERRLRGEPMAYIRGVKEFWSMELSVDPRVMIPRPETEILVDRCVRHARSRLRRGRILAADVGTGSGAVACALVRELPEASVVAIDISADALAVARRNVEFLGLSHRIRLVRGNLLAPLRRGLLLDIVAANLPYVPTAGLRVLPEGIRDYEPHVALDGGADGLEVVRRLLYDAQAYLGPGGLIALEVEDTQVEEVEAMIAAKAMASDGGVDVDMAGFKRVVWAEKQRQT
jgi:release factor glutamine methyltransferase